MSSSAPLPVVAGVAAAGLSFVLVLFGCRPAAPEAAAPTRAPAKVAASQSHPAWAATIASPAPAARALLVRMRAASRRVPLLRARALITRWNNKGPGVASVVDVIEAPGGRFRLTYSAPKAARGRLVVSDGASVWQYEPRSQVVLKRPVAPPRVGVVAASPKNNDNAADVDTSAVLMAAAVADEDTLRPEIAPIAERIAGRPTRTLLLRGTNGRIVERHWVDDATGRSLRTEEYETGSGRLLRRVELSRVSFGEPAAPDLFRPAFPAAARVVTARTERVAGERREARRLGLPAAARGYRLHSVVRPPRRPRSPSPDVAATHLVYSNGARAVSVFVTENVGAGVLHPQMGWRPVPLGAGRIGFAQEEPGRGRSAVAWVRTNRRFVAIAALPLGDFLPISRILAAGREKTTERE